MSEIYVIVSYYSDGSGTPEVNFANTPEEAISITAEKAALTQYVSVYKVSDAGSSLVTGKELRTRKE